ncbi:hypothetical protein OAU87_03110 [Alphaproteobacteria bacterium]|nr:hypothetical protein [Alphaproteobacteria bacterium]MDC3270204.1 hypothetical protein [Alphaproteobacteria bacterium]
MKRFILFFLIILFSHNVLAAKTDVVLTGFSINAEYKDLERSAYYTNKLLDKYQGRQNIIDQTLQREIRSNTFNHINILEDSSLISSETSKIAMSVFLDQELFEEFKLPEEDCKKIKIANCYIYNINNYFQIIFFDFDKMTFLKAIPFQSIYISDPSSKLNDDQIVNLFIKSYEDGKWLIEPSSDQVLKNNNDTFISIMKDIKINEFYDFYIGVNPSDNGFIINEEKVINLIPDSYANNLHLLKRNVANTFLGELALKHNLVVVPYFEGVGVGNKIRGKYADQSEAFLLEIPEPTYFIDFNLRGFVKQKYKKDSKVKSLTWYVYGAGINLRFYEPLMDKEYLNIKMTKADFKKIPDILTLNKTNEYINIINLTYKPLAIEFSNIINSDFKNNEDLEWLKKITKKETKKKEILEFKKFIDKIKSIE